MYNKIEKTFFCKEIQENIKYKVFYYKDRGYYIINQFFINDILYYQEKKDHYFYANNFRVSFDIMNNIIEKIKNKVNISIVKYEKNNLDDEIPHQSVKLYLDFNIFNKDFRYFRDFLGFDIYDKYDDYNFHSKINTEIEKKRTLRPIIDNVLKEIFIDIYYDKDIDLYGEFKQNELDIMRLKKEMDNF